MRQTGSVHHCCYGRGKSYYPCEDLRDFAYRIEVKENARDQLRKALGRLPVAVVVGRP